jgi:hypothetical protein
MDTSFSHHIPISGTFEHVPLLPWEIRLVELLAGEGEQEILCNIKAVPSKDAKKNFPTSEPVQGHETPPYIALSYAWGNPKDTAGIILDGQTFQVTMNLWAACTNYSILESA